MTREQTKTILATMAAVYPPNLMPQVTQPTIDIWFYLMQDVDYQMAQAAVAAWLTTNRYPPTIADIRERMSRPTDSETAEAAWGVLLRAIRRYGYTDEQGGLNSLSERSRAIVSRFGWRYFCQMPIDEESTYFAQFRNAYNVEGKREAERLQIPEKIRESLKRIGGQHETALLATPDASHKEEQPGTAPKPCDRETMDSAIAGVQAVLERLRVSDTTGSATEPKRAGTCADAVLHAEPKKG